MRLHPGPYFGLGNGFDSFFGLHGSSISAFYGSLRQIRKEKAPDKDQIPYGPLYAFAAKQNRKASLDCF